MPDRLARPGCLDVEVRTEQVRRDPGREQRGRHVDAGGCDQDHDIAGSAERRRAGANPGAGREPGHERQGAAGRRDGVGHHQLALATTCGRPADRAASRNRLMTEFDQDESEQHRPGDVGGNDYRQRQRPARTRARLDEYEHLAAGPPVQEHADEGSEDAERQQHGGKAPAIAPGVRRPLRREQDVGGERHLEDAVTELAGDPDREQPAEAAAAEQMTEVAEETHCPSLPVGPDRRPAGAEPRAGGGRAARRGRSAWSSPLMNASTDAAALVVGPLHRRATSSGTTRPRAAAPPMPRSLAIFAARIASMMMPAEFGESQTSSLYSMLSGTSPNARPSSRT